MSRATLQGGAVTILNPIYVASGDAFAQAIGNVNNAATVFGQITLNGPVSLVETGLTGSLTVRGVLGSSTGAITGSNTITITSDAAGLVSDSTTAMVTLTGFSPTFTGNYSVTPNSSFRPTGNTTFYNAVMLDTNALLDISGGGNTVIAGLASSGSGTQVRMDNGSTASQTLTIAGSGTYTFGGVIGNRRTDSAQSTSLTVSMAPGATQILTGANAYTGTTTVSGGTLQIGNGTSGNLINTETTFSPLTFGGNGIANFMEAADSSQSMGAITFAQETGRCNPPTAATGQRC